MVTIQVLNSLKIKGKISKYHKIRCKNGEIQRKFEYVKSSETYENTGISTTLECT
jgi:hypothetical protein